MLCTVNALAQPNFSHINPSNSPILGYKTTCVIADKNYNIWFGTYNGLYCYDGSRVTGFFSSNKDSESLKINVVSDLYCDKFGTLWISTGGYLHYFDTKKKKIVRVNTPSMVGYILFSNEQKDSITIVDFYNVYKLNVTTHKVSILSKINTDCKLPKYGVFVQNDTTYICMANGFYRSIKGNKAIRIESVKTKNGWPLCEKIIACNSQYLLITTWGAGFFRYDKLTGKAQQFYDEKETSDISFGCSTISDSIAWVGTNRGIIIFNFINTKQKQIRPNDDKNWGLQTSFVNNICKDFQNNIWVAGNCGLEKYDALINNYLAEKIEPEINIQNKLHINSCFKTKTNETILSSDEGFLYKSVNNKWKFFKWISKTEKPFYAGNIFYFNNLLYSFFGEWLISLDFKNRTILPVLKLPSNISCVATGWQDELFIGTTLNGIYCLKNKDTIAHFSTANNSKIKLLLNSVMSISVGADSNLLITYNSAGLSKFSFKTKQTFIINDKEIVGQQILKNKINELYFQASAFYKNRFYVATRTDGILIIENSTNKISFLNPDNSAVPRTIDDLSIIENKLYFKSPNGFFQVDLKTFKITNLTQNYEFINSESFNACLNGNSQLLITHRNWLYTLDIGYLQLKKFQPATRLISLLLNNNEIDVVDNSVTFSESDASIKINLASNCLSLNRNNTFYYRFKNLQNNWIVAPSSGTIEFPNLKAGNYYLECKTETAFGNSDAKPLQLFIKISPPFYRQWWFILLIVFTSAAIIFSIYRLRLQKEIEALKIRNSISKDLHDDIGSTLSAINIYSSLLTNQQDISIENQKAIADKIFDNSKDVMEKMSDIVWSLNPDRDDISDLIQRLKVHGYSLINKNNITFDFDDITQHTFTPDEKKNIFLIYKEALNNSLKYAMATDFVIKLKKKSKGKMIFSIVDNGKGFDVTQHLNSGNGLKNMQSRAKLIGAILEIKSDKSGTTINLTI